MNVIRTIACLGAFMLALGAQAQVDKKILGERHAMVKLETGKKYLLLPVQESQENAHIRVIKNNQLIKTLNCQLAVDKVDYFVPYEIGEDELFDITFNGNPRSVGDIRSFTCWQKMTYADKFDDKNTEKHRPIYHQTPKWGWMNDPNGMFYKDGVWQSLRLKMGEHVMGAFHKYRPR